MLTKYICPSIWILGAARFCRVNVAFAPSLLLSTYAVGLLKIVIILIRRKGFCGIWYCFQSALEYTNGMHKALKQNLLDNKTDVWWQSHWEIKTVICYQMNYNNSAWIDNERKVEEERHLS